MSDEGQEQVPHHHTLGEILHDETSVEEKVARAARAAPILVIAIVVHVILGLVLGMVYFHEKDKAKEQEALEVGRAAEVDASKIEEKADQPKEIERTAIPQVDENAVQDVTSDDQFQTVTDDVVNPDARNNERFGVAEGEENTDNNLLTMSSGGKGLAGAIGVGASGAGAGGGARKGNPFGGSRVSRRSAQSAQLQQTEKVVMAGLEWLKRHQSPDGSWDCDNFASNCDSKLGPPCSGRGQATFDSGVTGLALLAFLGAGYDSQRPGAYLETVKNGLKYLKQVQDAQGCFGPQGDTRFTYAHACATLAMCEAYASSRQPTWKRCAQAGIDFINTCQNPYKAWRYGIKPGDNDSSVTGWMLMALKSGKDSGLMVNERTMKDGVAFVDSMTDEDTGRTGYTKKGEPPVRPEGQLAKWPAAETESLTAVAMCSRIFTSQADGNPLMKAGAELLSKKLPVWNEASGSIDMYYWYYGTLAMFQMGGNEWERWNKNLKTVVIDNQVKDGCAKGSWEPKDPWCDEGGRVYATSLMTLCLEVYYRYPKVFGTGAAKK